MAARTSAKTSSTEPTDEQLDTLLLIEDDELDAQMVRRHLRKESAPFTVVHVSSLQDAEGWLAEHTPSIILADLNLLDSTGVATVTALRALVSDVALVALTGTADEDTGVQAMRQGAQEYLVKEQLEGQLLRTVRYAKERARIERALKASQQALIEASKQEAIGRLAAKVAHDLNNMLTLILPCADMLRMRLSDDAEGLEDVKMITDAARRSQSLVKGLLAFGRKQMLRPAPLDLSDLLSQFAPMLSRTLGESIQLVTELSDRLPPILFDASQMELILVNLAANAREAVKAGGGRVLLQVDEAPRDRPPGVPKGDFARLIFEDDGQGIDPEVLPRLFEPFFTTRPASGGNGVGLASVYGVIRQSGGHIHVDSAQGEWTRFTLYLPFAKGEGALAPEDTRGLPPPSLESLNGTERILVVEDEPGVRSVVVRALRQAGYSVLDAGNGPEALALEMVTEREIHLMLSDVVMPQTNTGAFVAEMCRRRPGLQVVLMSGYAADETIRHGVELGEHGFIQKPFTPPDLLRQLRIMLDAQHEQPRAVKA